jgi:hypothetical protein
MTAGRITERDGQPTRKKPTVKEKDTKMDEGEEEHLA